MSAELIPAPDFVAHLHDAVNDFATVISVPTTTDESGGLALVVWCKIVGLLSIDVASIRGWPEELSLPGTISSLRSLTGIPVDLGRRSAQEDLIIDAAARLLDWHEARDKLVACLDWAKSAGLWTAETDVSRNSSHGRAPDAGRVGKDVRTVGDLLQAFSSGGEPIAGSAVIGFAGTNHEAWTAAERLVAMCLNKYAGPDERLALRRAVGDIALSKNLEQWKVLQYPLPIFLRLFEEMLKADSHPSESPAMAEASKEATETSPKTPEDTETPPDQTPKAALVEEEVRRLLQLLGEEDAVKILDLAHNDKKSADDRMREIIKEDRRFDGFDSYKWAQLLNVTASAIRQTVFWQDRKARREQR
jgi:hypothetical protein